MGAEFDYALERSEFENGRGFVVMRLADGQRLRWESLPRGEGIESVNVVGERYRLDNLQHSCFEAGNEILLEREPRNSYDSNAIAVWNAARTLQAGYIPRDEAKRLAKKLDKGIRFRVLTIWETFEADRRIGIRLLLLGEEARVRTR